MAMSMEVFVTSVKESREGEVGKEEVREREREEEEGLKEEEVARGFAVGEGEEGVGGL